MPWLKVRSSSALPILIRMDLSTAAERLRSAFEGRAEIVFAYIFGSTAQGRTHARSDVDVAVYVEPAALEQAERNSAWGYLAEVTGVAMDGLRMNDVNVVVLMARPGEESVLRSRAAAPAAPGGAGGAGPRRPLRDVAARTCKSPQTGYDLSHHGNEAASQTSLADALFPPFSSGRLGSFSASLTVASRAPS